MNSKPFILLFLVPCFAVSFSGICAGKDPKTTLTVKNIAFTREKGGVEKVALFCNQSCTPELFSIEEENPRVVMDMKGVSLIQTKTRNVNTGGTLVKRVRSYLDKKTKILRVVLDMEPSKYSTVRPLQNQSGNTYALTIKETTSLSEQKPGGSNDATGSSLSQEKRITILRPDLKPGEQEDKQQEAAPPSGKSLAGKTAKDVPSVDEGRAQLNAGDFAAAVDTFTRIIVANPQDSLSYRLRGNAYDNLADRRKALADWKRAAKLGDTVMQSYLDFLKVKWRGKPTR
jgi:tetratricopeptide (TPR) repeat protein